MLHKTRSPYFLLTLIITALLPFLLMAAEDDSPKPEEPIPQELSTDPYEIKKLQEFDFTTEFIHMIGTLGVFLAALLILAWIFQRLKTVRVQQLNVESDIKVIERRVLTPRGILYLLDVQGHRVLISESPAGIHHVATLPEEAQSEFSQVMAKKGSEG